MTIAGGRIWTLCAPLNLALLGFVLFFTGLRVARPGTVFYYTEGPVLGSLAALETGGLPDLYPSDGWVEPPVVLTLYPPTYFAGAAALNRWFGRAGSFAGLRIVSATALLGLLVLLGLHVRGRRAPPTWILALTAAAFLTPGVYRLAGGAQADTLALLFTWVGITAAFGTTGDRVRSGALPVLAAGTAFLFAIFTKQDFVAAPAALFVSLVLEKRFGAASFFAAGLAAATLAGVWLLDTATAGGYLANTLGALTGASGWEHLTASLGHSRPLQWFPICAAILFVARSRLRIGFPEIYLAGTTLLHTAAMLKTGSSVNYLLEPTFALLLLAVVRGSAGAASEARESPEVRPAPRTRALAMLFAAALALTASDAVVREYPTMKAWVGSAGLTRVAEFEGLPLVDPLFFPAVLERGGRPWLNDPFAFGALEETGQWDPARLVSDLEDRRIPFALTTVDVGSSPAPPGVGTRDLVMAYFWRSRPVWTALTGSYEATADGPVTVWLPREDPQP